MRAGPGDFARARYAMRRFPSAAVSVTCAPSTAAPAMGAMGGWESASKHIGSGLLVLTHERRGGDHGAPAGWQYSVSMALRRGGCGGQEREGIATPWPGSCLCTASVVARASPTG